MVCCVCVGSVSYTHLAISRPRFFAADAVSHVYDQQSSTVISMAKEIIMLSSYTYAQKARDYLYKNGIYARVIKTPERLSS